MSKKWQEIKAVKEDGLDFESWHALRGPSIPAVHKKEILKADFAGRGLTMTETLAIYDEALKKYGITLN